MPRNPNNPRQRRARTPKGEFIGNDPKTEVNEAWVDADPKPEAVVTDLEPIRKPAGKPLVRKRVAKPKIGAVDKVRKPTFGIVRGVYN